VYSQSYDPLGNGFLSTLAAAVPVITLVYFLALHPHWDERGERRLGISAPWAALAAVGAAFAITRLVMGMPPGAAVAAFAAGALNSLMGIVLIIVGGVLMYDIALVSGTLSVVDECIARLPFDRRLQSVLVAFSGGAIIEGISGLGVPVAVGSAMLVALGFAPFPSAVLNLLANTAPVAWGAIGTPMVGLAQSSGLPALDLSTMAGRQLPWVSLCLPFVLVAVLVKMEGGAWREAVEVWPTALASGGVFAIVQWTMSSVAATYRWTAVLAGLSSILAVLLVQCVWHPPTRFRLRQERGHVAGRYPYGFGQTLKAWIPWVLLLAWVIVWSLSSGTLNAAWPVPGAQSPTEPVVIGTLLGIPVEAASYTRLLFDLPGADNLIQRTPPFAPIDSAPERVQFTFNWLSAPGTAAIFAAVAGGVFLRLTATQWRQVLYRTARRVRVPLLIIAQVLGVASLTRYAGTDAILGLAFTVTGPLFPFFGAYLGWLGVVLTGSDTGSNTLFGGLQRMTAEGLHLNPLLAAATNASGGVMGKVADPQAIAAAAAACYDNPADGLSAIGPIFRRVFWISLLGAAFVGGIALLQEYLLHATT
jgi:lactate permease